MPNSFRVGHVGPREWHVKPPRNTQVNWKHPSARGLKHLILLNDLGNPGFAFDIAYKAMFKRTLAAGTFSRDPFQLPHGTGVKFNGPATNGLVLDNISPGKGDFGFLIFFKNEFSSGMMELRNVANEAVSIYGDTGTNSITMFIRNDAMSSASSVNSNTGTAPIGQYSWAAGGIRNNKPYIAAGKIGTPIIGYNVGAAITGTVSPRKNFYIGAQPTMENAYYGTIAYIATWDRFVDVNEMNRLINRPYSFMETGRTVRRSLPIPVAITRRMWQVKPPRGAVIDRTHPSARSIKHLFPFNELTTNYAFDIASRRLFRGSTTGITPFAHPHGTSVEFGPSGKYLESSIYGSPSVFSPSNSNFGFLAFFRVKAIGVGSIFSFYTPAETGAITFDYYGGSQQYLTMTIRNDVGVSVTLHTPDLSVVEDVFYWTAGGIRNGRPYLTLGKIGTNLTAYIQGNAVTGTLATRNRVVVGGLNGSIAYLATWDRFVDVGEMNRLISQPYSIIRNDRPSVMYPMVTTGQQIHLSGPPHPSTTIRRTWTVKPPRGSIVDRENPSARLLKHLILFNDLGPAGYTFDIAYKAMFKQPTASSLFQRKFFPHPHGTGTSFSSSSSNGLLLQNTQSADGDFGFLIFYKTDYGGSGGVLLDITDTFGVTTIARVADLFDGSPRFTIRDASSNIMVSLDTSAYVPDGQYGWVAGGIRNRTPYVTAGVLGKKITAYSTIGTMLPAANGVRRNIRIGANSASTVPYEGTIAYIALWDRFVDIAEMNRLISQPYSIITRTHRPGVFIAESISGQPLHIVGETASYELSRRVWRVKPPRGAQVDLFNPSTRLLKYLFLFNELGSPRYAFDIVNKFMLKSNQTGSTFQRSYFPHPHGSATTFTIGASTYGLSNWPFQSYLSDGDFGFLIFFKFGPSRGTLLYIYNTDVANESISVADYGMIFDDVTLMTRNTANSPASVSSLMSGVPNGEYAWVAGGIRNNKPYIAAGIIGKPLTAYQTSTALTGTAATRKILYIGANPVAGNPMDGSIAYIAIWNRFIDIPEMKQLIANPYSLVKPIDTILKNPFGVQRVGQQTHITGRAATATGQQIHLNGIVFESTGSTTVHFIGFSESSTANKQIHMLGGIVAFPHAAGALIYVRGLSLPGAGISRIVYTVTAVEGPVTGSWARLFGRLVAQFSPVLRENISEQETLLVIEQITEGWNWSENVTQSVFSCPIPNTTLINSTTLYPC